ncbi:hypothetical protein J2S49_001690 [Arcanobacterium wilhelmae]|uniref:AMIN-like domain-containing protein n=1 Tax=Arcanobacterium wilhelmae TaxID=1803177 RepID=A0ABT9ND14_9ACTO|nr:hypothetical protein [Arcanobacterium wilhelmae]MDP9801614.1 hypothetical protein [Arcanobacterium wilhelmae]WFN90937.1 hypothetical protein P8A24_03545 [Arcanobacterium wilhelmae]
MKNIWAIGAIAALTLAGCSSTATSTPTSAAPAGSQSDQAQQAASSSAPDAAQAATSSAPAQSSPAPTLEGFTTGESHSVNIKDLSAQALPVKVRMGSHPDKGYDRVVIEYSKAKAPVQWNAGWTKEATEEGSGFPVDLRGDIILEVFGYGIRYPGPLEHVEELKAVPPAGSVITEVKVNGGFEGSHQIYIGSDKARPYKVTWMDDPARLVIDVAR